MKCDLGDIKVNYEVYGEGKPVIMLHGCPVDSRLMKGCMEPVFNKKSGYKRIYMDLPGMGKTKGESFITSQDLMLNVVIRFIKKVVKNENFLLAGESYGGYLARGVVYKMPEKIDGLFLLCPAVILEEKKRNVPAPVILKKDKELLSKLAPEDAKLFDLMGVIESKNIWERFRDEILSAFKEADIDFINKLDESGYDFSFNVDDIDIKFDKPTSIILGRQDSIVGYKDAWKILEKYPRATFAILDMASHNLQLEQEEIFNSLVCEWLKRVEEQPSIER